MALRVRSLSLRFFPRRPRVRQVQVLLALQPRVLPPVPHPDLTRGSRRVPKQVWEWESQSELCQSSWLSSGFSSDGARPGMWSTRSGKLLIPSRHRHQLPPLGFMVYMKSRARKPRDLSWLGPNRFDNHHTIVMKTVDSSPVVDSKF